MRVWSIFKIDLIYILTSQSAKAALPNTTYIQYK